MPIAWSLLLIVAVGGCVDLAPREIVVVARGMTFALVEQPDAPNPVIRLRAGERVRLVLRNEAPGLLHDLTIPAWSVQLAQIRAGETSEAVFTVPTAPGRFAYTCRPHAELMHSFVEVSP